MTMLTPSQVDNWDNLSPEQRAYFTRLAEGDPDRSGRQFFEDTVPENIQDDPEAVDIFLNGGTVTVADDSSPTRGRGATGPETREVEIEDKDWSHDTSRANGGSDSADNGRFESASTNRARGANNTTASEQAAADKQAQADADVLEDRIEPDSEALVEKGAMAIAGTSLIADAAELAIEGVMPITAGIYVASKIADKHGKGAAIGGGLLTTLAAFTPPGQIAVGCYFTYKLARFGFKAVNKVARA